MEYYNLFYLSLELISDTDSDSDGAKRHYENDDGKAKEKI